jgi:hypothetical protein
MDSKGDMYIPPELMERLFGKKPSGTETVSTFGEGVHAASPAQVARVLKKAGSVELNEDQAAALARENRAFRRIVASEMRRGAPFDEAWGTARSKA